MPAVTPQVTVHAIKTRPNKDTFLKKISFTQFKQLKNVTISFSQEKKLTCIMGVNGIGKTTILQALSCIYNPVELDDGKTEGDNNRFVDYLKANKYARWKGSCLQVDFIDSAKKEREMVFSKNNARWSPRYNTRPYRCVRYFNISSCLPAIERDKYNRFDQEAKQKELGKSQQGILVEWAAIMNVPYSDILDYGDGWFSRETLGVMTRKGETYLDYTMGAGEQRVFFIVEMVFKVPEGSLILIDEIELLLHAQALKRFVEFLSRKAKERNLQIVFTSHSVLMTTMREYMNIEYLSKAGEQTLVSKDIPYDAFFEFAADSSKPLHLLVEDLLSEIIIQELCRQLKGQRFVQCKQFGSSQNGYVAICGLALNGLDYSKTFVISDGDVNRTKEEQKNQIKKYITGTEPKREEEREDILSHCFQYELPEGKTPEEYIHQSITQSNDISDDVEVKQGLREIRAVTDKHQYVSQYVYKVYPNNPNAGYAEVIDCFLRTKNGKVFVKPVLDVLEKQIKILQEVLS